MTATPHHCHAEGCTVRRDKTSGLPPSRCLRWIDEMGDRILAISGRDSIEGP